MAAACAAFSGTFHAWYRSCYVSGGSAWRSTRSRRPLGSVEMDAGAWARIHESARQKPRSRPGQRHSSCRHGRACMCHDGAAVGLPLNKGCGRFIKEEGTMAESAVHADMPYRVLGRTGEQVSAIGLGGWHVGFKHVEEHLSQHHEILRYEDPHRIFAADGANAALVEARQAGKLRYIGFTGHKDPHIHLHMLEVAKENGFTFDTVQMPLNVMDAHYRSFEKLVLPELVKQQIGVLGMKPLANGIILQSNTVTAIECLHYALNLPTSVVITGVESLERLEQAFTAARTFRPMSQAQRDALLAKTATAASRGEFELFKTTSVFDATATNPAWLGAEPDRVQQVMPEYVKGSDDRPPDRRGH